MSADNWTACPACKVAAEKQQNTRIEKARKAYGVASPEEYERLLTEARKSPKEEHTLREDYEFHMSSEGEFFCVYNCSCDKCKFAWKFKHEEDVPFKGKEPTVT